MDYTRCYLYARRSCHLTPGPKSSTDLSSLEPSHSQSVSQSSLPFWIMEPERGDLNYDVILLTNYYIVLMQCRGMHVQN